MDRSSRRPFSGENHSRRRDVGTERRSLQPASGQRQHPEVQGNHPRQRRAVPPRMVKSCGHPPCREPQGRTGLRVRGPYDSGDNQQGRTTGYRRDEADRIEPRGDRFLKTQRSNICKNHRLPSEQTSTGVSFILFAHFFSKC